MIAPQVPANEEQRLAALHQLGILDTPPEAAFDDLARIAAAVCAAPIAMVCLADRRRIWVKARVGSDTSELPRDTSFCGHAILCTDVFTATDLLYDERFADNPLVIGHPHIRFYAAMPLVTDRGVLGTLCVMDSVKRELSVEQGEGLRALGRQVLAQLDLRRQRRELQHTVAQLDKQSAALRRQAALLELAHDAIVVRDLDGRIRWWNRGAEEIYGWPAAQAEGQLMHELLRTRFPDDRAGSERALLSHGRWEGELINVSRTGAHVIVDSCWVLERAHERELPAVLEINRDITSRRHAEEMNRLYTEIVSEMQIGLHVYRLDLLDDDRSLHVVAVNPAAEHLIGVSEQAAVGRTVSECFPALCTQGIVRRLADVVRQRRSFAADDIRFANGSSEIFALKCFPLPDHKVGVTFENITQRRAVERMKSEFVSMVSHELRTPLTSIRGSIGLLLSGLVAPLPEPAVEMLEIASNNTERLVRLINNILDLEKRDAGMMQLRHERIDVRELIARELQNLKPIAVQRHIRLAQESSEALAVMGDRDSLSQVLTNLLGNAIKFSPEHGLVAVSAVRVGDRRIRVSVADQGPGIAAEHHKLLFKRFQQINPSDSRPPGGTGLGLAISHAFIEDHGGQIGVDSQVGQGSRFWFELPAA